MSAPSRPPMGPPPFDLSLSPAPALSTKALAITSSSTRGTPPPPLMGCADVMINDAALHCFGGRLENRDLTNCHYVLDIQTGTWEAIQPAQTPESVEQAKSTDPTTLLSLSLTTDPVNNNSESLSGALSVPPQPRYFHTLSAYGTSLILFGGMGKVMDRANTGEDDTAEDKGGEEVMAALDDLHVFDIVSQRWEQKHPRKNAHSPQPRWAHMATILDHFLVVIGGTDTVKAYVEDACVLDLYTWEWVASVQGIGQCGSYRTVAATGPSKQSSTDTSPSSPSFPSANASSPQTSSSLSWASSDSGPIDAMASISMVLSGKIVSTPSSTSSVHSSKQRNGQDSSSTDNTDPTPVNGQEKKRLSERLMSSELTPSFKKGRDVPSIYLYSNYNFQNLQRDLKVITPHYTHSKNQYNAESAPLTSAPPSFSIVEKSQALNMAGHDLPPGLRFPQGHVYQNQLIVSGTLIVPGKGPTLAIYAFNLALYKWERLSTDSILETGSWSRTLLHPATGTLLIFGNHYSNADTDYANRLQHHDHLMMINLQAYGLYERPIPSFPVHAQELGQDLLNEPSLNDMHVASVSGTLFGANSTVLAARWPEFATLLLSPPYVTPLVLVLPVPDEVVPLFLLYLYTGALPTPSITAGVADYLLILARRYDLNGLYALTMDILHQTLATNPVRIYGTALLAGELGLQARAVGMAIKTLPAKRPPSVSSTHAVDMNGSLIRGYSTRVPPPSSRPPVPPERRREGPSHSRDSMSTDGGMMGDNLLQQYQGGSMMAIDESELQGDALTRQQLLLLQQRQMRPSQHPMSFMSTSSGGSNILGSAGSPGFQQALYLQQQQQQQQQQQLQASAYPSPLSPSFPGYMQSMPQAGYEEYDDGTGQDSRSLQAKKRLQMQMQMQYELDPQQQQLLLQQQQEYLQQQQVLFEQQHLQGQEMVMLEQHRLQQQRYLMKQQRLKKEQLLAEANPVAILGALDYHLGGGGGNKQAGSNGKQGAGAESVVSQRSGSSKNSNSKNDKDKKGIFTKIKPPKSKVSGADLMKSAGF